jgi:hypothetical protein
VAATEWRVWADLTDPGDDQVGSVVGTTTAATAGGALWWWLDKAGIKVDQPPTTGQGWPR